MKRLLVLACLLVAPSAFADSINVVKNGDFSLGNANFGTSYVYQTPNTGSMWDPGTYTVDTSAALDHALWETGGDHTTGNGNFMLVNGYTDQPNKLVWSQLVGVEQNTTYFFEAFAKNLCCKDFVFPNADLLFYINGTLIGSGPIDGPGNWQGISSLWHSGDSGRALLEIRNGNTVYSGNDFGLDDIYLGTESSLPPAPEPASLLLLGGGLLAVGRRMRQRKDAEQTPCQ